MANDAFLSISLISLFTLIISGGLSYIDFQKIPYTKIFWNIVSHDFGGINIMTVEIMRIILYIIFSILLFFSLFSFIIIIMFRNDNGLREGILGKYSKFHFIPILCATSLYIIGETYSQKNMNNDISYIFSLIFSGINNKKRIIFLFNSIICI